MAYVVIEGLEGDSIHMSYSEKAQKRYNNKVKRYITTFSLSDQDQSTVRVFNEILERSGLSANAYLKKLIEKEVPAC